MIARAITSSSLRLHGKPLNAKDAEKEARRAQKRFFFALSSVFLFASFALRVFLSRTLIA
jgi:hypothetical protein